MQLFNGLNMGILNYCKVNFNVETDVKSNWIESNVNYESELQKVQQNVDVLKDDSADNDNSAKEKLSTSLTDDFCSWINWYLEDKKDKKQKLTVSLQAALQRYPNEASLQKLKNALGLDTQPEWEPSKNIPKLDLQWELSGVVNDGTVTPGRFYSNLVENKPVDQSAIQGIDENLKLRETEENLWKQIEKTGEILGNNKFKGNEDLVKLQTLLANINKVIVVNNESNVKILQKFISDNLDWEDKEVFDRKSKKGENFDWKFWVGTLAWLNKVLEKTWKYIDSFKNQPNEWAEDEPFKKVKVKENFSIKWVSSVNAEDLIDGFDGLPDGATAEFKDGKWINIKNLYNDGKKPQEVTVILKIWDKTREITISAGLDADNQQLSLQEKQNTVWTPERPTTPIDTTPYVDNQWNKYQVMGNSQTIAGRANLHWVTFYAAEAFTGTEPKNGEQWQTFETPANGDYECLMKMWDSVYKVKVDQNWNICPTAVNMMSNVPVVMENSASGKAYIENKLPDALKGKGITIWWDWEDYTISLPWWWKNLTVEPMTIDWKWIWSLTDSLAFLNLTNYLRNSWKMHDIEFKNDNPDLKLEWDELYVKVKRTRDVNWKKISLLKVSKDTFWLPNDEKLLKKYISYNNSEDWNDKWDKKKPNKYYKHVKLQ